MTDVACTNIASAANAIRAVARYTTSWRAPCKIRSAQPLCLTYPRFHQRRRQRPRRLRLCRRCRHHRHLSLRPPHLPCRRPRHHLRHRKRLHWNSSMPLRADASTLMRLPSAASASFCQPSSAAALRQRACSSECAPTAALNIRILCFNHRLVLATYPGDIRDTALLLVSDAWAPHWLHTAIYKPLPVMLCHASPCHEYENHGRSTVSNLADTP